MSEEKRKGLFGRLFGAKDEPLAAPVEVPGEAAPPAELAGAPEAAIEPVSEPVAEPPEQTWFQRLKTGLGKTSSKLSDGITGLFTKRKLDANTLEDLEDLLIQSDLGLGMATRPHCGSAATVCV